MDARDMSQFKTGSFNVVIDKAMLDAIITGDKETCAQVLSEVHRVLKPTGKFISISHGSLDQRKKHLKKYGTFNWNILRHQILKP